MLKTLRNEAEQLDIDPALQIHICCSASVEFETEQKVLSDHQSKVEINCTRISQKDLRADQEKLPYQRDHITPYRSRDVCLLRALNEHTLFTSGDTEEQRFKTAYARAVRPLFEESALVIQRWLMKWNTK
jgi:hypothetical protein